MPEFYTVRHGQASYGTDDYDQLSPLGESQSQWLGHYFAERGVKFDRIVSGDLKRHRQTAAAICAGMGLQEGHAETLETYPELNEFHFEEVVGAYLRANPAERPPANADKRQFFRTLKNAMHAWIADTLDVQESWQAFEQRVAAGMDIIAQAQASERTLVVSSGGTIAMLTRLVLGAPAQTVVQLNMQTRNTSMSRFFYRAQQGRESVSLHSFNHTPHLEHPERQDAITYG